MIDFTVARLNMVESQVRPNGITDRRIIAAIESVAREAFGSAFIDYYLRLKRAEIARFEAEVSEWE